MSEHIKDLLSRLDNSKAAREVFVKRREDMMNSVITDEIKQQLKDIDAELKPDFAQIDEVIANLTAEVKDACVEHGESVKGEHMRVSFIKGRVTWNSKGLEGYAVGNPEVLAFRKEGNPYASVKNV